METQLEAPNPTPLLEVVLCAYARPLRREREALVLGSIVAGAEQLFQK